ncbi:DUF2199 domain-containing protein [Sphingobium sp. AN558]|uniref:DUF2199 domain-containing protein n=1 Tax=Sphingobium sp. AN558 TaxID=3133442 RepID=UPI0030C1E797
MFGFRNKPPTAAQLLRDGSWRCDSCDAVHGWPFDLAARAPDPWPHGQEYQPNGALRMDGNFLSEDFCVLDGKYFMIRAVLTLPVQGLDEPFGFGCWSTLSRDNFDKYLEEFDGGCEADETLLSGCLCNRLADYVGTDPLAIWVQRRPNRQRPLLWVMDDDHPLAIAQEEGISADRMLEIFDTYGHGPKR